MSKPNDNGGAAFPVIPPLSGDVSANGYPFPESGMSLRDYFAGQALASMSCVDILEWTNKTAKNSNARDIASAAYLIADAMIEARGKSNG